MQKKRNGPDILYRGGKSLVIFSSFHSITLSLFDESRMDDIEDILEAWI